MKNTTIRKKIIVLTSIIGVIFAVIALILGGVYIAAGINSINKQMDNFNVNKSTILWLADLGKTFFNDSTTLVIIVIVFSVVSLIVIAGVWIAYKFSPRIKTIINSGTKRVGTLIATSTIAASLLTVANIGMGSTAIVQLNSQTQENISKYFETNATEIGKDKNKAAKAALLYTLLHKDNIKAFGKSTPLEFGLITTLFMSFNENKTQIQKDHPKAYAKLLTIDLNVTVNNTNAHFNPFTIINPLTTAVVTSSVMLGDIILQIESDISKIFMPEYEAIISDQKTIFNNLFTTKIASITKSIKSLLQSLTPEQQKKTNFLEILIKMVKATNTFETVTLATIARLTNLPYITPEDQLKSRLTILEWLNTTIKSINYISKNEKFVSQNGKSSTWKDTNGNFKMVTNVTPKKIYLTKMDPLTGKFSLDTDQQVGKEEDMMYDVRERMMKKIITNLPVFIIKNLALRQKSLTNAMFVENILKNEGLQEATNQYVSYNSLYNSKGLYGLAEEKQYYKDGLDSIFKFINYSLK